MRLENFWKILSLLLLITVINGCSAFKEEVLVKEYVKANIPIQPRPQKVDLLDVNFRVVSPTNLDSFLKEMEETGDSTFFAITVNDYENLSLNMSELRRYILQQKSLIIYYEKSITGQEEEEEE